MRLRCLLAAGCAGVVWAAPAAPCAVTNLLTAVIAGSDGDQQTLASTNWTDGCAAHAGADYLVALPEPIRLPIGAALVFGGNSLQLGTAAVRAMIAAKRAEVIFGHDGLFLCNVVWDHWFDGADQTCRGRMTVLSPQSAPVQFTSAKPGTSCTFTGPWFGAADCGFLLRATGAAGVGHRLRLTGDLGGYAGRMQVASGAVLELGETAMPGEIRVEGNAADGLGPGKLGLVSAAARLELATLTLGAGAALVFDACRQTDGSVTGGQIRVTGRLSVASPATVEVPTLIRRLAGAGGRRFPFLVRAAGAEGNLDLADFVLANAAEGVSLEVAGDPATGDRTLFVVLAADPQAEPVVTYEDLGATGDGVADDQSAIVATHAAANRLNLPVRARDEACYRIGGGASVAVIGTDVDWGTSSFVIDDTAVTSRGNPIFRIPPSRAPFAVTGVTAICRGERRLGCAPGMPCVLVAQNANRLQFIRAGNNENHGAPQAEVYLVDADGVVDADVPMTWDFDEVTSLAATPIDAVPLAVRGGRFTTIANQAPSVYDYYSRNIRVERSNVTVSGLRHDVVGEGTNGAPYAGFIQIDACANVTVSNCVLAAHRLY